MTAISHDGSMTGLAVAQSQTALNPDEILHSVNCGVLVERVAQIKYSFRSEGRKFARDLAAYINQRQKGVATVFVYEETFGQKDRIHWFIQLRSLHAYERMVQMGTNDEEYRQLFLRDIIPLEKGGGTWDRIFVDGSMRETVLLPQFWGMYGTAAEGIDRASSDAAGSEIPPAHHQCSLPVDRILHSGNCGAILHRSALVNYEFRSEARKFAREALDAINQKAGQVTGFLYEEAFGCADRIHWLLHMESIASYYWLIRMHAQDETIRDIFFRERVPESRGGGNWSRLFVPGSMVDTCLTPQHWGMYVTQK